MKNIIICIDQKDIIDIDIPVIPVKNKCKRTMSELIQKENQLRQECPLYRAVLYHIIWNIQENPNIGFNLVKVGGESLLVKTSSNGIDVPHLYQNQKAPDGYRWVSIAKKEEIAIGDWVYDPIIQESFDSYRKILTTGKDDIGFFEESNIKIGEEITLNGKVIFDAATTFGTFKKRFKPCYPIDMVLLSDGTIIDTVPRMSRKEALISTTIENPELINGITVKQYYENMRNAISKAKDTDILVSASAL